MSRVDHFMSRARGFMSHASMLMSECRGLMSRTSLFMSQVTKNGYYPGDIDTIYRTLDSLQAKSMLLRAEWACLQAELRIYEPNKLVYKPNLRIYEPSNKIWKPRHSCPNTISSKKSRKPPCSSPLLFILLIAD